MGVEIVASGVLALSSTAAYWVSVGEAEIAGWWLWGLTWFQSAGSIVYAYLRLEQRAWVDEPPIGIKLRAGRRAILYTSFNLGMVLFLSALGSIPTWLAAPYALQWLETMWGSLVKPAVGYKPTKIGFRQLAISSLFTLLFIVTWRL
jgi:hypothetical protein